MKTPYSNQTINISYISGNATRLCDARGLWTGSTPSCQPIACGDPVGYSLIFNSTKFTHLCTIQATFPHASVALLNGSTVWRAVAHYQCIHGYRELPTKEDEEDGHYGKALFAKKTSSVVHLASFTICDVFFWDLAFFLQAYFWHTIGIPLFRRFFLRFCFLLPRCSFDYVHNKMLPPLQQTEEGRRKIWLPSLLFPFSSAQLVSLLLSSSRNSFIPSLPPRICSFSDRDFSLFLPPPLFPVYGKLPIRRVPLCPPSYKIAQTTRKFV